MKLLPFLFLFNLTGIAFGAIDLSPVREERVLDGIKFQQLVFRDGERQITYEPPRGWKYNGDSGQLKLTPPDIAQARGVIDQSPLTGPQAFSEESIKELQAKTLKYVPPGSREAAIVLEEKNPVFLDRHETYEITVSYRFMNEDYLMSVLYVNLQETELRFRLIARKADFEKLHRTFRGSVFSWQWTAEKPARTVASRP
jgi:hypothetical protein